MTTITETVTELRSVPRSARVAQGFPRLRDFARHVLRVRARRAGLRRPGKNPTDHVRDNIERTLGKIFSERPDLRRAARQAACCDKHDAVPVVVEFAPPRGPGKRLLESRREPTVKGDRYVKYPWSNCGASDIVYHHSTRHVSVPAVWLLRQLKAGVA